MSLGTAAWHRPLVTLCGLLLAYFAFPVGWDASNVDLAVGLTLTLVGLMVLGRTMVVEVHHLRVGAPGRETEVLALMLALLVVASSLTFYLVELLSPGQFSGIATRADALYFTLSTMTTVGYGDVHAEGQLARVLVCGLIVFNVVVVAALVRAHTRPGPAA